MSKANAEVAGHGWLYTWLSTNVHGFARMIGDLSHEDDAVRWGAYMLVVAVVSKVGMVMQIANIVDARSAANVSLWMYVLMIATSVMWVYYGWKFVTPGKWTSPLVVSSGLALLLALLIVLLILCFEGWDAFVRP